MTGIETAASILSDRLSETIRRDGPITVADYMSAVAEAYYSQGDVFGTHGDFITAPEISQTFGEMIGLWCATVWQNMGRPNPCRFVECGPGRGTLMADALRAARAVPEFLEAADVHLIERSSALEDIQRRTLGEQQITWHKSFDACPDGPLILVANEFLDALPICQFEKTTEGWMERRIGADEAGRFHFTLCMPSDGTPDTSSGALDTADIGTIYETSPAIFAFVRTVAKRIARDGGVTLIIDYGHKVSALGDTLQAVKRHKPHSVLEAAGTADITAHVDFGATAKAAQSSGTKVLGPIEQGIWLKKLGIMVRGTQLARGKPSDIAKDIEVGIRRLTEPDAMGALFKIMAITHPDLVPPDGFRRNGAR